MIIASEKERDTLRQSGERLSRVTAAVIEAVRPGVATAELDAIAAEKIRSLGGDAVFKGYRIHPQERPYPASICVSINDEIVHGIPSGERKLAEGDIVGIDLGLRWPSQGGLVTDMAMTVGVGGIDEKFSALLSATKRALEAGIAMLNSRMRLGDLGHAIQQEIEQSGFSVVEELVGHGVGKYLHENPYVPNYGIPGSGALIAEGSVFAIEPMAAAGSPLVKLDEDGWTWRTEDGSRAAHFEHTVIVGKNASEVVTRFPDA